MPSKLAHSEAPHVAVHDVRKNLAEILNRVAYRGERIVLHRRGREVAVLIPVEDLQVLEAVEDRIDAAQAKRVLAEMEAKAEKPIPYERVRRELGLRATERPVSRRKSAR